jgi:hypothetical protein
MNPKFFSVRAGHGPPFFFSVYAARHALRSFVISSSSSQHRLVKQHPVRKKKPWESLSQGLAIRCAILEKSGLARCRRGSL